MSIDEAITKYILKDEDIKYYFNLYCVKLYDKKYDYNLDNCKIFLDDLFKLKIFKSSYDRSNLLSFASDNNEKIFIFNLDNELFRNKLLLLEFLEFTINEKRNNI